MNFRRTPIFCWRQNLCRFFSMAGRYNRPVQYGRESAHKSRAARGNATLSNCMKKGSTPLGRRRRSSAKSGRSQQLWTLPSQTVRRSFCVCASFLSTPTFCRRQYFVDANILSMPVFCRRQCFVAANIFDCV